MTRKLLMVLMLLLPGGFVLGPLVMLWLHRRRVAASAGTLAATATREEFPEAEEHTVR